MAAMTPKVLLQAYYKRGKYIAVPCPADPHDDPHVAWWWDHLAKQAHAISTAGFTSVWLPPVTKAAQGMSAAAHGYSVFDDYDIGSKSQKATVHTRYGNREQLTRCAAMLRANGLETYLDLQLNHRRGGVGPDGMTFEYVDAYGNKAGGRFPKNAQCFHSRYPAGHTPPEFHPEIPEDPDVPDGVWELREGSKVYFGPDLAHLTSKPPGYVRDGLVNNVAWLTRALDIQGYRLDHVQGISRDFLLDLLSQPPMRGLFAVGEYWDGDVGNVHGWVSSPHWMGGRCSAFDFPLYFRLLALANDPASVDMASLDHAGLVGVDPFHAVTFVENHDTESRRDLVSRNIQPEDKPFVYAYILTSEGLPCVFYKDWSRDPGCLGDRLQPIIQNLIWIHQKIAEGPTQQRWKDRGVFVYERTGGRRLLVALNKDKAASRTISGIATGFPPHTALHDYTGHSNGVSTDSDGRVRLTIPRNAHGLGYVCLSVTGIANEFANTPSSVTQVFEGARDLDIKPADNQATIRIGRIFVAAGEQIDASLTFDDTGFGASTRIVLELDDPSGATISMKAYGAGSSGERIAVAAAREGWYLFRIHSQNTATVNDRPPYKLAVTYTGPTTSA